MGDDALSAVVTMEALDRKVKILSRQILLSKTARPVNVSALSDARTPQDAEGGVRARAFDKAVRRKPLARRTRHYGD
jgi:hypothetical protein